MATYNWGIDKTFKAASDMSWYQYRPVVLDTNGRVTGVSALGASCIGILQNDPELINEEAVVRVFGFTKVWATGAASTFAKGDYVQVGGGMAGGVTGHTTVNAACTWSIGIAQEGLTSGSAYVEMFFNPMRQGV